MSDNGDDFSDIVKKYNCIYHYSDMNILGGKMINEKKHMGFANTECLKKYLDILKLAIEKCGTEYIVFMEDDVIITGKIQEYPKDSGGNLSYNYFKHQLTAEGNKIFKSKYPNAQFDYWNLAGGSIINSQVLLDCIKKTSFDELIFFNDQA
jgi:hypothetical protein